MFDSEEQEILEALEDGKLILTANMEEELKRHRLYATETFKKDKRITIRISSRDLDGLKKIAILEGIPYQTLVSSILHKYVNGRFTEKPIV